VTALIGLDDPVFVALDVGTKKVCVLVGHLDAEEALRVIGVGIAPTRGMRKGGVIDLQAVTQSIRAAKEEAEKSCGLEIGSVLLNLSGGQIQSMNSTGMAGVSGRVIGADDVNRALEAARSVAVPHNREIIHVIPRAYVVDGQDGIRDAIGMHGYRLEVEAHIVTAAATALRNLEKSVEEAGIAVDGWVLSSLAAGEVVLTETEREMGVVVCDLGAGTTDIAIYIEGAVWHSATLPVGGDHLTNDIAQGLHLPQETAEAVKRRHGHALRAGLDAEQVFAVRPFGADQPVQIRRLDLATIVEPRVEEIFALVRQEIKRSGYDGLLPAGLVLTGGTSLLPGIRQAASKVLGLPVRLAKPENLNGMVDRLGSPAFSTSVGLLQWAIMQENYQFGALGFGNGWFNLDLRGAMDFLRRLLPG